MKASEMRDLPYEELQDKLDESKEELFNLRFQVATGQLDNPSRVTVVKKEIARMLTELRAREIADADAVSASVSGEDS